MSGPVHRRDFFARALGYGALAVTADSIGCTAPIARTPSGGGWRAGEVEHLLPTVDDRRLLLKASFRSRLAQAPRLLVGERVHRGEATGTHGRFFQFDVDGLPPATSLRLQLVDYRGEALCDPWPLSTFPSPDARPRRLRVLMFTCAGGHDVGGRDLPVATSARLLDRGLSFAPDALVANGDHIYWDLRTSAAGKQGASPAALAYAGRFERTLPVLGTPNEHVLERAVGPQIAGLYGTRCRSLPVFFLQDDHDYFENDEADDAFVSFPPDSFMLALARAAQRLYYPEFLPDRTRPLGLPSASADDRAPGVSESFGTLRYGQLAELLMYDCRRFMTLAGASAVFVPREVEAWLVARATAPGVSHVIQVPSVPPGWTAGKWGEWYADLEEQGRPSTARPKPFWQQGWRAQHDRLVAATAAVRGRIPLVLSGDLHCTGEARILSTGGIDLRENPVTVVLAGTLGTGAVGWPSARRGMRAQTPVGLEVDERLPTLEENGFLLVDFTPDAIELRYFRWKEGQSLESIDVLQPFRLTRLVRQG